MKSLVLFRHHNTEVCPTVEINSTIPDSTLPGKHLESFFCFAYWIASHSQFIFCHALLEAHVHRPDQGTFLPVTYVGLSHLIFSTLSLQPCSHFHGKAAATPIPRCAAHREVSCGSSPLQVFSCRMDPWGTMEHTVFICSWKRTCQFSQELPSHSWQTLHARYHPQQKIYEQGSSFVDVMRHCSYYHKFEKLVTRWPWSFSSNFLLIQLWQHFI